MNDFRGGLSLNLCFSWRINSLFIFSVENLVHSLHRHLRIFILASAGLSLLYHTRCPLPSTPSMYHTTLNLALSFFLLITNLNFISFVYWCHIPNWYLTPITNIHHVILFFMYDCYACTTNLELGTKWSFVFYYSKYCRRVKW